MDSSMESPAIDAAQIDASVLPVRSFTSDSESQFRVVYLPAVHAAMWEHAKATLSDGELIREVGGILIGDLYRDALGPYLEVTSAIPATHTRNEGTEVTFTPETWAEINRVKDAEHPNQKMVGWYHTHPNFGIFLSERDCFVHRHSFPQPWAIAHVIDPVQALEGLFVWQAGEPTQSQEFWVGSTRRDARAPAPPAREQTTLKDSPAIATTRRRDRSRIPRWLPPALCVLATVVAGYFAFELKRLERERRVTLIALHLLDNDLDRPAQLIDKLRAELDELRPYHTPLRLEEEHQALRHSLDLGRGLAEQTRTELRQIQRLNRQLTAALEASRGRLPTVIGAADE